MAGDLETGEAHPAAKAAATWVMGLGLVELMKWQGAFSSCAIENNRLAEVCSETLRRLMNGEPASDRYVLGLAWAIRHSDGASPRTHRERAA